MNNKLNENTLTNSSHVKLRLLKKQCGMMFVLLHTRSNIDSSVKPSMKASADVFPFFHHVIKNNIYDVTRQMEQYACTLGWGESRRGPEREGRDVQRDGKRDVTVESKKGCMYVSRMGCGVPTLAQPQVAPSMRRRCPRSV
ncbi:hypothetical protein HWV62_14092 [Athelia sp. TMB]|nr:hypothetical protein HWV62_14092 [Athelia sp. TMB]